MTVRILFTGNYTPRHAVSGDAGVDLRSDEAVVIQPGCREVVKTGISIALPNGYVGFVMPRSGLAAKFGVTLVNSPGVIDAGYRGEIKVVMINTDLRRAFHVSPGDRIAQLIIMPFSQPHFIETETLPGSARGVSAFGSTGGYGSRPPLIEDAL